MNMIRAIVLSVLVSAVIWALTFDFLFPYSRLVLALIITLAGVLVSILILYFLRKAQVAGGGPGLELILPLAVTGLFLFVGSMIGHARCKDVSLPVVWCNPARVNEEEICVRHGGRIEWELSGVPQNTLITINDFQKLELFKDPQPAQPLNKKHYEGDRDHNIKATVRPKQDGIDGSFKYSVTCTPQGGIPDVNDPMIEIPR